MAEHGRGSGSEGWDVRGLGPLPLALRTAEGAAGQERQAAQGAGTGRDTVLPESPEKTQPCQHLELSARRPSGNLDPPEWQDVNTHCLGYTGHGK